MACTDKILFVLWPEKETSPLLLPLDELETTFDKITASTHTTPNILINVLPLSNYYNIPI